MENMQKALIMAGSVFMFVIAVSVAIFSYHTVTSVIDTIMTASDNNARTAEYFIADTLDVQRYVTKAEVVMTILKLKDADFVADEVIVNGKPCNKTDTATELEKIVKSIAEGKYSLSYKSLANDNVVVQFSKVSE